MELVEGDLSSWESSRDPNAGAGRAGAHLGRLTAKSTFRDKLECDLVWGQTTRKFLGLFSRKSSTDSRGSREHPIYEPLLPANRDMRSMQNFPWPWGGRSKTSVNAWKCYRCTSTPAYRRGGNGHLVEMNMTVNLFADVLPAARLPTSIVVRFRWRKPPPAMQSRIRCLGCAVEKKSPYSNMHVARIGARRQVGHRNEPCYR